MLQEQLYATGVLTVVREVSTKGELLLFPSAVNKKIAINVPSTLVLALLTFFVSVMTLYAANRFSQTRGRLARIQFALLVLTIVNLGIAKGVLSYSTLNALVVTSALPSFYAARYADRVSALAIAVLSSFLVGATIGLHPYYVTLLLVSASSISLTTQSRRTVQELWTGFGYAFIAQSTLLIFGHIWGIAKNDQSLTQAIPLMRDGILISFVAHLAAGLIATLLEPMVARLFGDATRRRLLNLTDLEHPLLKQMAKQSPGSWEHARAMANLAESSAAAIDANALLLRVGAYFHDLGKSLEPKYFIENLGVDEVSPHLKLSPHESAQKIIAHVVEGTKVLRDGGLPEAIVEFAYTHHGTSRIEYFWHAQKELMASDEECSDHDEIEFCYPGMEPATKETALLMIVDAVEAGARTVQEPTPEKFAELVRRIIFNKLQQGQLSRCGLSGSDLSRLANALVDTLGQMYHARIRYPWQDDK